MNATALLRPLILAATLATAHRLPAADLGQPAPTLDIATWVKGKPVDLAAGKGKTIYVVEFWATWCPPCRATVPHLSDLQKQYASKDVVIVGISDETADKVKPFVEKMGDKMAYTVALDPARKSHKEYMEAFGVRGIPHAFVVDKTGTIAWHGHPMAGLDLALQEIVAGTYDIAAARRAQEAAKQSETYLEKARSGADAASLKTLGEAVLKDGAADPGLLNELSWAILTDRGIKSRDLDLATRAARAAYERTAGKDPSITDTYARALFDTGRKADAIRLQKEAIAVCKDATMRQQLEATLKGYEAR
jgi:thiol-disulfide isomerase/thioredoxin